MLYNLHNFCIMCSKEEGGPVNTVYVNYSLLWEAYEIKYDTL